NEVVVVHPDRVASPQQWHECVGEAAVDAEIGLGIYFPATSKVKPIVKSRPHASTGKTVAVAFRLVRRQIDVRDGQVAPPPDLWRCLVCILTRVTAPAEPQPARSLQGVGERNGETARLAFRRQICNTIGDNDQTPASCDPRLRLGTHAEMPIGAIR